MGQSNRKINYFWSDLAFSTSSDSLWEDIYHDYFSDLERIETVTDKERQLRGVDRIIHLRSGRAIRIDEKLRDTDYEDICLEYIANSNTKSVGWVEKELDTEYIFYLFKRSSRLYVFPFADLQYTWKVNKARWLYWADSRTNGFNKVLADNGGYTTSSIAVPIEYLYWSIWQATGHDLLGRTNSGVF